MKIVVTGSEGHIGKHYAKYASIDHTVIGLDKVSSNDIAVTPEILEPCDIVVHMAATNGTRLFYETPAANTINDTLATLNVVKKYQNTDTKIVFTSSCEIFNSAIDAGIYPIPTDENVPAMFSEINNPRWSYSIPKLLGENLIANCGNPWLIIRYFNVYGPGQKNHFIDEFVNRVKNKEYYITGNDTRSFCYIDDAVEITHKLVTDHSLLTVNVGNPDEIEISIVAKMILDYMNVDPEKLEILSGVRGSVTRRCPDVSLLKSLIGPTEYTSLKIGLAKTIESLI